MLFDHLDPERPDDRKLLRVAAEHYIIHVGKDGNELFDIGAVRHMTAHGRLQFCMEVVNDTAQENAKTAMKRHFP